MLLLQDIKNERGGDCVVLENKLGLTNVAELAKQEELLSKKEPKNCLNLEKYRILRLGHLKG